MNKIALLKGGLNSENKVFVGKRIDNPQSFWQMPQGGVDKNEDFLQAAKRELKEETGIKSVELIKEEIRNYSLFTTSDSRAWVRCCLRKFV